MTNPLLREHGEEPLREVGPRLRHLRVSLLTLVGVRPLAPLTTLALRRAFQVGRGVAIGLRTAGWANGKYQQPGND